MHRVVEILLVEDNADDVRLTMEALKDVQIHHHLTVARDGAEALAVLRSTRHGSPRPDLVLLDLALPRLDGFEVLSTIKRDPDLRAIPVVILSASSEERDIHRAYELQANTFLTKSADLAGLTSVMRLIEKFWLLPRIAGA